MILIFGGAYQGKLEYALSTYKLVEKDVYHCDMESMVINFDKKIIADLEKFVLACVKEGINAKECLEALQRATSESGFTVKQICPWLIQEKRL